VAAKPGRVARPAARRRPMSLLIFSAPLQSYAELYGCCSPPAAAAAAVAAIGDETPVCHSLHSTGFSVKRLRLKYAVQK